MSTPSGICDPGHAALMSAHAYSDSSQGRCKDCRGSGHQDAELYMFSAGLGGYHDGAATAGEAAVGPSPELESAEFMIDA
jgi:hypothetical protein